MPRRAALVLALVLVGQAVPSLAGGTAAPGVRLEVTVLPGSPVDTRAWRATTVALRDERMVGITWAAGRPEVQVRWRLPAGWSPWAEAEDDSADSPVGTPGTAPQWRPEQASLVQVRVAGSARDLRLVRVSDGPARLRPASAQAAMGREVLGVVHSRRDWGADESIRRGVPSYARRVDAVVVHHTANANGYSAKDVPGIIRADYAYHVRTRGWSDLGYNLLVDQFGGIWEGRAGGVGRAVVGAHAEGFNTGTLGVALLGDLTKASASGAAEKSLARVIAHAAATWGFDPTGAVALTSKGSPRYPAGKRAVLRRAFGHLETSRTACPAGLQDRLSALRALAKVALGPAPVIRQVSVTGAPVHAPTPLLIDARLSLPASWSLRLAGPGGKQVAGATGAGTAPRLSWDGTEQGLPVLPGTYSWTLSADDGFHDVVRRSGQVEVGLPLVDRLPVQL